MLNVSVAGVDLEDVKAELIRGIHAKDVLAQAQMRRVAAANARLQRTLSFGEVFMRLPVHVALAWKRKEGDQVLSDAGWQRYMRKHFPELFPKSRSQRLAHTVVAPGMPGKEEPKLVDRAGRPLAAGA